METFIKNGVAIFKLPCPEGGEAKFQKISAGKYKITFPGKEPFNLVQKTVVPDYEKFCLSNTKTSYKAGGNVICSECYNKYLDEGSQNPWG